MAISQRTDATPRTRPDPSKDLREHILETASALFYAQGVRAVGVDLVTVSYTHLTLPTNREV